MKYRVLDSVLCPACGGVFDARGAREESRPQPEGVASPVCRFHCALDGAAPGPDFGRDCAECFTREVVEAELVCRGCGDSFRVDGGIPIFLKLSGDATRDATRDVRLTQKRFGFQWNYFGASAEEDELQYFREYTGVKDENFFRGKLALDGGCGSGRFIKFTRRFGAREVFGFDFSRAAEKSREAHRGDPFVHILRCDIFNLPFRPEYFDYVYTLGVIHHTPDPERAFSCLARHARPGGWMTAWVYEDTGWKNYPTDRFWRPITTRLPQPLLFYLCFIAAPLGVVVRWRFQKNLLLKAIGEFVWIFFRVSIKPRWRDRVRATFDCYAPPWAFRIKAAALKSWFEKNGFADLQLTPGVTCLGRREEPAGQAPSHTTTSSK